MNQETPVPFVDLRLQQERVAAAVDDGIRAVLANSSFVLGPAVSAFEEQYATYCGARRTVGVANGTDALEIALRAAGVGAGDEVILPANTFVATAEAVANAGAEIVLADCDDDYLIDVDSLGERLTPRTRAVIPVHLYGQLAPMEAVREAVGPDVLVIEDAAQAQGATRHGRAAGSWGDVAATSFYPGKNLGAYGDAGALTTDSDEIADAALAERNHGGVAKYEHLTVGRNSRLDGIQAAVLSAKLPHLDGWNEERRIAATRYEELLKGIEDLVVPRVAEGNQHVWHLYVVRVPDRDRVLHHLAGHGIGAGIHYPRPVHLWPAFSFLGQGPGSHPRAESFAEQILSLPMFPGITDAQQERVAAVLTEAMTE